MQRKSSNWGELVRRYPQKFLTNFIIGFYTQAAVSRALAMAPLETILGDDSPSNVTTECHEFYCFSTVKTGL